MLAKDLMTQDYVSVDQKDTVSKLLGKLITKKQKQAIVLDGKKYLGVVDKKAMLDSRLKVDEAKIKKFLKKTAKLDNETHIRKACEQMVSSDCQILPLTDKEGKVEGAVLAKDIIKRWANHAKGYTAKDIEREKLVTVDYNDPIGKVINIIRHSNLSHIPVVELAGNISGVVSTIDILEKFFIFPSKREGGKRIRGEMTDAMKERDLMKMPIQNYMSKDIETAKEDDSLTKVIDIMTEKGLSDVIITREDKPIGIVTTKDILRLFSVV